MKTVCELNMCNGCMACVEKCHRNAITIKDDLKYYNALIDTKKCVDCGLCTKVCPRENDNDMSKPKWWYQGWADSEIREHASSGGAASAIIRAFIKNGGYVASCLFDSGKFVFEVTNEMAVARKFAGSKYVKSNPEKIYGKIQSLLKANQKVLFIGLPCQVAAVNQFIKDKTNLVTADLICHGTPSPYLLKKCLQEYGHDINTLTDINFRIKSLYELNRDGKPIAAFHTMDNYLIAFLHSYDYTENCYSCKFATLDRVSDITLGDSWGTELSGEVKNGVSLILCQSEKGKELIESAGLNLLDVDINNAISHNEQLNKPSKCSKSRDQFFENYNRYNNFGKALVKTAPGIVAKEKVKSIVKYIVRGGGTQAFMITVKDGKM
ncbi:Coenzyme F420 hydrogenase/dehydrogenase, beta subunit C-terminal domain [Clostridium sp. AF27-5AA]|uniref:Coenzyme F420 hydrogenase/dehydrogenase, beta subunit C-terminal domain n=1 Tax=Clostridium sp. AF27-5AA TaxID=2293008 RepID=UPI000E53DFE8|nr:Coenzyme F420 hydrogenase/dehydrogenase, beta subunit C-terminal domain [Clostridium sp. AF27-5AA]RHQ28451.1 4Fe-4S dicluster domain-containing protein [Clostridium sp. AF27-5AA]